MGIALSGNVFESGYLSSTSKIAIECFDEDGEEAAPPRMEKIEVYSSRKEMPHQFLDPNNPKIICPICNQVRIFPLSLLLYRLYVYITFLSIIEDIREPDHFLVSTVKDVLGESNLIQ